MHSRRVTCHYTEAAATIPPQPDKRKDRETPRCKLFLFFFFFAETPRSKLYVLNCVFIKLYGTRMYYRVLFYYNLVVLYCIIFILFMSISTDQFKMDEFVFNIMIKKKKICVIVYEKRKKSRGTKVLVFQGR